MDKLRKNHGTIMLHSTKTVPIHYDVFFSYRTGAIITDYAMGAYEGDTNQTADLMLLKQQIRQEIMDERPPKRMFRTKQNPTLYARKNGRISVPQNFNNRYEYFFPAVNGLKEDAVSFPVERLFEEIDDPTSHIWEIFSEYQLAISTVLHETRKAKNLKRIGDGISDEELIMIQDYIEHRDRIDEYADSGHKLLFIAHSDGNLYANRAYDYAVSKPNVRPDTVAVVHIAPTSYRLAYQGAKAVVASEDLVIRNFLENIMPELKEAENFPQGKAWNIVNESDIIIASIPDSVERAGLALSNRAAGAFGGWAAGTVSKHVCVVAATSLGGGLGSFVAPGVGTVAGATIGFFSGLACEVYVGDATRAYVTELAAELLDSNYDVLGHGMEKIYLNKEIPAANTNVIGAVPDSVSTAVYKTIDTALKTLVEAPPLRKTNPYEDAVFVVELSYEHDAPGSVFLDVEHYARGRAVMPDRTDDGRYRFSPNKFTFGSFERKLTGSKGAVTTFKASCDPEQLLLGRYTIRVANTRAMPEGSKATVKVFIPVRNRTYTTTIALDKVDHAFNAWSGRRVFTIKMNPSDIEYDGMFPYTVWDHYKRTMSSIDSAHIIPQFLYWDVSVADSE